MLQRPAFLEDMKRVFNVDDPKAVTVDLAYIVFLYMLNHHAERCDFRQLPVGVSEVVMMDAVRVVTTYAGFEMALTGRMCLHAALCKEAGKLADIDVCRESVALVRKMALQLVDAQNDTRAIAKAEAALEWHLVMLKGARFADERE